MEKNFIESAIDAGKKMGWTFHDVQDHPVAVFEGQMRLESLEPYMTLPLRKKNVEEFSTVESFNRYVNEHKDEHSRIYATETPPLVTVVFDEHESQGAARWRQHRAKYFCPLSPEWMAWIKGDQQPMEQVIFAEFLEDNSKDVVVPDSAGIVETALTLSVKKDIQFSNKVNLANGAVQFTYNENLEGKTKGQVEIPQEMRIRIPVFTAGAAVELLARVRWRLNEGKIVFFYKLDNPDALLRDAFLKVLDDIEIATTIKPYL